MKKLLLALVFLGVLAIPIHDAWSQCTGVFANNTFCGNISGASAPPRAVPTSSLPTALQVGTTTVTSGTTNFVLAITPAGILGQYAVNGSGNVVLSISPNMLTPSIASPALSGTVTGNNTIPLTILSQSAANTMLGNWTAGAANVSANVMPSCADSGGNHLNYVNGTGVTCGTSGSAAAGITIGTSVITGGTDTRILRNSAGVVGEYTLTGTGTVAVMQNTPTLITPVLGAATATTINGNTFTAGTYTLTGSAAKTLTFTNSLTLTGTDATTMTFPTSSANVAALNLANQSLTGGATVTATPVGVGNFTLNCGARPLQYTTNQGAFSITAPTSDGHCALLVTNTVSAAGITLSGFSVGSSTGDAYATTNAFKYTLFVWRINGTAGYRWAAHQ